MVNKPLQMVVQENQWTIQNQKDMVFGEYNGYLFTVYESDNEMGFVTSFPTISDLQKQQVLDYFKANRKRLDLLGFKCEQQSIIFKRFEFLIPVKKDQIYQLLQEFTTLFRSINLAGVEKCRVCEKDQPEAVMLINGFASKVHQHCYQKLSAELKKFMDEYIKKDKHYIRGFFGSLCMAFVGAIPWIIVYLMKIYPGTKSAVLSVFILFAADWGYNYFNKGLVGKLTRWLITAAMIIGVGFGWLAVVGCDYLKTYSLHSIKDIQMQLLISLMKKDLTYLFVALGTTLFFSFIIFLKYRGGEKSMFPTIMLVIKPENSFKHNVH